MIFHNFIVVELHTNNNVNNKVTIVELGDLNYESLAGRYIGGVYL